MDWAFDPEEGYGDFCNDAEVRNMRKLDNEDKKINVKQYGEKTL